MKITESIRHWAAGQVLGPDLYGSYQAAMEMLEEIQQMRPVLIRDRLASLAEVDTRYMDLMNRLGGSQFSSITPTESQRLAAVAESRDIVHTDPTAERAVKTWTDFGFGTHVAVSIPSDDQASKVFKEFWTARRNSNLLGDARLHQLCHQLLSDGEFFFIFFVSRADGRSTVRVLSTEEIQEIVCDPNDKMTVLLYRRAARPVTQSDVLFEQPVNQSTVTTVYYRDWNAKPEDLENVRLPVGSMFASDEDENTDVVVMHVAFNQFRADNNRGWPLVKTAAAWMRAYHNFLENRLAVSRAVAAFVDKIVTKGGSAPIQALRARLDARLMTDTAIRGEPPIAATWLENESATRSRLPMSSGAGDARVDGMTVLAQAGVGVALPPGFLGRSDAFQNRSVADVSLLPTMKAFERFQLLWSSVWRDVVSCVLLNWSLYNSEQSLDVTAIEPEVSSDALMGTTVEQLQAAVGMLANLVTMGVETSQLEAAVAFVLRLLLRYLGAQDVELLVPEKLKFAAPPEEPNPQVPEEPGQPGEPEEPANPFATERLSESHPVYHAVIRYHALSLYEGYTSLDGFVEGMTESIKSGLNEAWLVGWYRAGMFTAEMGEDEEKRLKAYIQDELAHVRRLGEDLVRGAQGDQPFGSYKRRLELWGERYNDIVSQALLAAYTDPKLLWSVDPDRDHCPTCASLGGIRTGMPQIRRASRWAEWGVWPQRPPNPLLQCKGFGGCVFIVTGNRCTPGPLPI